MKEIKSLFHQLKGTITETDNNIELTSINEIKGKKVQCSLTAHKSDYGYSIGADEKTYELIGGVGTPCKTEQDAIKELKHLIERYNFKYKEQLNLFDLEY